MQRIRFGVMTATKQEEQGGLELKMRSAQDLKFIIPTLTDNTHRFFIWADIYIFFADTFIHNIQSAESEKACEKQYSRTFFQLEKCLWRNNRKQRL